MNTNLIGRWRNEYGSILDIQSQSPRGALQGIYTSETGASGVYIVNGWSPDVELSNQPVAISVFWRPTNSTNVDPSWTWVSVMNGVLFLDTPDLQPVIQFLHGMVASTPFEAVQVERPGVYTESLTFRRAPSGGVLPASQCDTPRGGRTAKRAVVTLTNIDPNSGYRQIDFTYGADGNCIGSVMQCPGQECQIQGIIDPTPPGNMQSLALTGLHRTGRTYTVGLGGFIDLNASRATLDLFESDAVRYANKYAGVAMSQERFTVSIRNL